MKTFTSAVVGMIVFIASAELVHGRTYGSGPNGAHGILTRRVDLVTAERRVAGPPVPNGLRDGRQAPTQLTADGASAAKTKDVKIRGYVTNVVSPTQFEIEDYRVSYEGVALALDKSTDDGDVKFEGLRVGVELEVKGTLNQATQELKAKSIKVDTEQFKRLKQTAILSQPPAGVERTDDGWTGTFLVDGRRIAVTPQSQIVFKLTSREKKLVKTTSVNAEEEGLFVPLKSLADVTTGMAMTYDGRRRADGTIVAERVEFTRNELEPGEKRMWESLTIGSQPSTSARGLAGELQINGVGRFKMIADERVQKYANRVGSRLVPAYQRELPDTDPNKIPFRFFVVEEKSPNAFALPNGIVVIHSSMFDILENEAQFAAVVGHEIAHAVQEHSWRRQEHQKGKRTALAIGAVVAAAYGQPGVEDVLTMTMGAMQNGYARSLENQSDRLGLEYMVNAGYDPREAPQVWKAMTKKLGDRPTNFFWSNHDNNATRRSYLMSELRNNYAQLNYARFRTNSAEYQDVVSRVRAAVGDGERRK